MARTGVFSGEEGDRLKGAGGFKGAVNDQDWDMGMSNIYMNSNPPNINTMK